MTWSIARSCAWPAVAALAAWLAGAPFPATAGDGSGTDNPALLRGTYHLACPDGPGCSVQPSQWAAPVATRTVLAPSITAVAVPAASAPGNCATLKAAGISSPECAGATLSAPVAVAPRQVAAPVLTPAPAPVVPVRQSIATPVQPVIPPVSRPVQPEVDLLPTGSIGPETPGDDAMTGNWQFGLKGSSTWDDRGQRYQVIFSPEGSLVLHRVRGELRLSAGLDLAYQSGGPAGLEGGNGAIEIDHKLDSDLMLRTALKLDGTREATNAVTSPANQVQGPLMALGVGSVEVEKAVGRVGLTLGGSVSRQYVGETVLTGGVTSSNAARNFSGFGLKARGSYALTPILSSYVEATADRAYFDAVASGSGARQDNWTYQARLGLSGKWRSGLTASLYGGYGVTQYDSALLTSGGGYVVGGSLAYPFGRGGQVTASLDTSFTPTDSVPGASTEVGYATSFGARYLVNDWLTLRGALGGTWATYPGATYSETGLSANAGLDWLLGTHASLTADYTFGSTWTPTASGQSHAVSLGLLVRR